MELRRAIELGRQVYIFVEASVKAEFATYQKNKEVDGIQYNFVDNTESLRITL